MAKPKISVIVAAGGLSKRFSSESKKQFTLLNGKPLIAYSLSVFESSNSIDEIVIVAPEDELSNTNKIVKEHGFNKIFDVTESGKERKDSVYNGFCKLSSDTDIVVIHDAARPFITDKILNKTIAECHNHGASISAIAVKDTIKKVNSDNVIYTTISREKLRRAQTPQTFRYDVLKTVYSRTDLKSSAVTDESQIVEQNGFDVTISEGSEYNIKITTKSDLEYAEFLIKSGLVD